MKPKATVINMKKSITLILAISLILGFSILFSSCSDDSVLFKINPTAAEKKVIGTAGGYEILYDELRCITLNYRELMELSYGDGIWDKPETAEKYRAELEGYVLSALKVNAAALKTAAEFEITPESDGVSDYISIQLNKLASDLAEILVNESDDEDFNASQSMINEKYVKYLKDNYLSDRYNRYVMSVDGCVEVLRMKLIADGTLPSDEASVKEYINKNFVHVLHISLPITKDTDAETARRDAELVAWILKANLLTSDARAELQTRLNLSDLDISSASSSTAKLYNRLINAVGNDEKMKVLVGSTYNKDIGISQNGYYFSRGEYSEAYENAAYALAEGEFSDVVADTQGFYVIQRLPLDQDYINAQLDNLKQQYQAAYINNLIEKTEEQITFSFNEYGMSLDLTKIK